MNTKLKCLLLDDELPALSYIKMLCEQIKDVEVIKAFNDPLKFIAALPNLDFNTCILDIQMPAMSGLEVATHLTGKLIIFTTAHKEFAAEAFDLNAVDYIRKPLQKERFEQALKKACVQLENKQAPTQALWPTDKGKTLIDFDKILYITSSEIDSRDKIIHLVDGRKSTVKNMNYVQVLLLLPEDKFCRINKREIITLKTVVNFTADQVTTKDGKNFVLSEIYREDFRGKINASRFS